MNSRPEDMVDTIDGPRHYALVNVEPSRYTGNEKPAKWPPVPICDGIRLPCFNSELEMVKHDTHCPVLLRWQCRHCLCFHQWTTSPTVTDTNGNWSAGATEPPKYILDEFLHADNIQLFRFIPK